MKLTKTKLQQIIKEELTVFIENKASTLDEVKFGKEDWEKEKAKRSAHADAVLKDIAKSKADPAYEMTRVADRAAKRRALDDKIKAARPKKRPKPDPARFKPVYSPDLPRHGGKATKVPGTGPRYSKWIANLQKSLTNAGFSVDNSGFEGPKLTDAIRKFQKKAGLTVDGKAGRNTMRALRKSDRTAQPGQFKFDASQAERRPEDVVGKGSWFGGKFYPSKKK